MSETCAFGAFVVQMWAWESPVLSASSTSERPKRSTVTSASASPYTDMNSRVLTSIPCPTEPKSTFLPLKSAMLLIPASVFTRMWAGIG